MSGNPLAWTEPLGLCGFWSNVGQVLLTIGDTTIDLTGKIWTSPVTAAGLIIGIAGVPFGADIGISNNAIWIENYPWGSGAITLGNTVISISGWGPDEYQLAYGETQNIGEHEEGHTYQYQILGVLFAPAYFLAGDAFGSDNDLESAAGDYANTGENYWPVDWKFPEGTQGWPAP